MRFRRISVRLLAAALAAVQTLAPGAASIADARPAAEAMSERTTTHADAPGTPHTLAHGAKCALCGLATCQLADPASGAIAPVVRRAVGPSRAAWLAHDDSGAISRARARAPPA